MLTVLPYPFNFLIISIIRILILTLFQTSIEYRNQFYDNHAHNFDSRSFLLSICLERSCALENFQQLDALYGVSFHRLLAPHQWPAVTEIVLRIFMTLLTIRIFCKKPLTT